jgi:hypothetical protein
MRTEHYQAPNPSFGQFDLMRNDADSSYQALQAQFRHRMAYGMQMLLSYTWAHGIDDASSDVNYLNVPIGASASERGSSDFDVRQTFSGAVSYNIPTLILRGASGRIWKSILGNWSTDSLVYARTAPPVNVVTGLNPFPGTNLSGASSVQRPNLKFASIAVDFRPQCRRRKTNQQSRVQHPHGHPREFRPKRAARIRGDAGRFDSAETVQTWRGAFAAGARGFLQHLQPSQLRASDQLHDFRSVRTIDADAGIIARQRRPEWRLQSAVSNRRAAIRTTGSEADVLIGLILLAECLNVGLAVRVEEFLPGLLPGFPEFGFCAVPVWPAFSYDVAQVLT